MIIEIPFDIDHRHQWDIGIVPFPSMNNHSLYCSRIIVIFMGTAHVATKINWNGQGFWWIVGVGTSDVKCWKWRGGEINWSKLDIWWPSSIYSMAYTEWVMTHGNWITPHHGCHRKRVMREIMGTSEWGESIIVRGQNGIAINCQYLELRWLLMIFLPNSSIVYLINRKNFSF